MLNLMKIEREDREFKLDISNHSHEMVLRIEGFNAGVGTFEWHIHAFPLNLFRTCLEYLSAPRKMDFSAENEKITGVLRITGNPEFLGLTIKHYGMDNSRVKFFLRLTEMEKLTNHLRGFWTC